MSFKPVVTDLSHHNTVSSFKDAFDGGLRGIIHKATEGTSYVDAKYASRKEAAIKAGFLWGAYHFATAGDVDDQVKHFLNTVGDTSNTLLALDYENNPSGGTMTIKQAREWLEKVEAKTGQVPVIYSGNLIKETLNKDPDGFWKRHRLWLAQYGNKARVPDQWDNYWLWQYTGDGVGPEPHGVKGIGGNQLDLNVYSGPDLSLDWIVSTGGEKVKKIEIAVNIEPEITKPVDTPRRSWFDSLRRLFRQV